MEILFLGTAAATSYPLAFCNCEYCKLARNRGGKSIRKRASILIDDTILIDLGSDVLTAMQMYGKNITKVKTLLQTHPHSDHFDAGHFVTRMTDYICTNTNNLNIIASHKCLNFMDIMIKNNEDVDIFNKKWQDDLKITLYPINYSECITIDDYKITAIESLHDVRQGSVLYLIEKDNKKMLYATDTTLLSDNAYKVLENKKLDLLILDQTYGNVENCGGHLNEKQFIETLSKMQSLNIITKTTKIYATHISHEGNPPHEEMQKRCKALGYNVAYDGLIIKTKD